mmetsp:Transcript_22602/g.69495  ORF Transcript_22602/g.69495 Transcript_22602/m.69495 type:complete len:295 (+) Transcript_22602:181-1065(+)|eukprot:CAMPEP_0198664248 /NCGR_PEP_ID=MMETSP1467-20131203/55449_1 /TAXON_ID=1462469 /ORGANISM="unid. sp., Strain CCMP2135" /LENGTH=294 /DNA_ID=CAMNT_0044400809 /DNA_START=137 /DNA_END=1021 /DNA_ORIENTATION=+
MTLLLEEDWIEGPDVRYLLSIVVALLAVGVTVFARYRRDKNLCSKKTHQQQQSQRAASSPTKKKKHAVTSEFLRSWGVPLSHVKRAMREIERKTFHLCGLLVPLVHLLLLRHGVSNAACVRLCWAMTAAGWLMDLARLHVSFVARHWPLRSILRDHEKHQLTGGCYFSLGCTLSITLSPPSVAMLSILFLVLGDMSAAVIGVSFGGEVAHVKLGRKGKKSLEGSVAMFLVCFTVGCVVFLSVPLREYAVATAAIVATLTELHEPFGLNDNLTIPLFSALALQIGLQRSRCPVCS